jgi:hypothetical protein
MVLILWQIPFQIFYRSLDLVIDHDLEISDVIQHFIRDNKFLEI